MLCVRNSSDLPMLDEDRSWFLSLEHQHFSRDRKGLQAVDKWVFFVWGGAVIRDSSLIKVLFCLGFPYGSAGKESAAMRETWVRSLGWEDPLEKGKATHSSILAWRIPWTMGLQRVGHD